MNATKRKFNALLNGLGNKSSTSLVHSEEANNGVSLGLSSTTGETDSQSKKRRMSNPSSIASRTSSITQHRSLGPRLKPSSVPFTDAPVSSDAPKFAPWDRAAFLERLRSFSNLTDWTPKPPKVNEVEWAKRGWVCQKFERVRCCLCNIEILVKLNKKEVDGKEEHVLIPSMIGEALVNKYAEMIVTAHAENCLWRQRGCDDTIFKLALNHAPTTLQAIKERYNGLCDLGDLLPYMHNIHPPDGLDLVAILGYLPPKFFPSPVSTDQSSDQAVATQPNRVAFIMALFGWHNRVGHMPKHGAVVCDSCFRTLGLWLFKSREVSNDGEVVRPASMNWLDPVGEHREYCPWRNAHTQSSDASHTTKLAAWEVVIRVLKNDHYLRRNNEPQPGISKKALGTPSKPGSIFGPEVEDADTGNSRDEKEKERWARLRRVKSLFDPKPSKKGQRSSLTATSKRSDAV